MGIGLAATNRPQPLCTLCTRCMNRGSRTPAACQGLPTCQRMSQRIMPPVYRCAYGPNYSQNLSRYPEFLSRAGFRWAHALESQPYARKVGPRRRRGRHHHRPSTTINYRAPRNLPSRPKPAEDCGAYSWSPTPSGPAAGLIFHGDSPSRAARRPFRFRPAENCGRSIRYRKPRFAAGAWNGRAGCGGTILTLRPTTGGSN